MTSPPHGAGRRFEGRVAIVTGSTTRPGIGYSCAARLASEGAAVVVNGRSPDRLRAALGALEAEGGRAAAVEGDAELADTAERLVATALDRFGGVDLLVNSVGGPLAWTSWEDVEKAALTQAFVHNVWPGLQLLQVALRHGLADGGGSVVNVSSGAPHKTTPTAAGYAAAKAALNTLTRTIASDLAGRGIRVNAVSPGITRTVATARSWEHDDGASAAARLPLGRLTEAEDVAATVAFLLSDDARQITGVVLDVDGGNHLFGGGWTPYGQGDRRAAAP